MAQAISPDPPVAPESSSFHRDLELAGFSPVPDAERIFGELRKTIQHGQITLPAMLQHIAEAARTITGANGTAIAIRHDNSVVCQATAGELAPPLGTKLDMDSGISGRCLRMGVAMRCYDTYDDPRVDVNVCHRLGLRSLALLPVGRKPVIGILEAFSARPNDFGDADMKALEQLAELVIAAQRRAAELDTQKLKEKLTEEAPPRWSKRNLILVAPSVLVLLVWLLFREKPAHSSATSVNLVTQSLASPVATTSSAEDLKPDSSPALRVWSTPAKARSGLVMASKTEKTATSKPAIVFWAAPLADAKKNPAAPDNLATPAPPVLANLSPSSDTALHGLLPTSPSLPWADIKVSQGVSGGTLERRVDPTYPPEAHLRRLEGRVLLQALVAQDGTVRDLKVLQGDPLLAHAAIEAVSQWRYRPYLLNGEPVPMKTEITLIFKLP